MKPATASRPDAFLDCLSLDRRRLRGLSRDVRQLQGEKRDKAAADLAALLEKSRAAFAACIPA